MKLTIIGCSGSMSGKDAAASAYLLQAEGADTNGNTRTYSVMLDFGPGAMGQSLKYVDPALLDGIIFSHLHADHCADIVGMQVYRRWYPEGALARIPVFSPGDGMRRTRQISDDDPSETYETEFIFHKMSPGDITTIGPMKFEFFAANHTISALSIRVSGPSTISAGEEVVFTYSGDTDFCEGLVNAAKGANLFLCEAAFEEGRDAVRGVHLTGKRAGEVANQAQAQELVLTHLQPWTNAQRNIGDARKEYAGKVSLAVPGDTYLL